MPSPSSVAALAVALVFLGGCCRDTVREMASIKDGTLRPQKERSVKAATAKAATQSAAADLDDSASEVPLETGSVPKPNCQGAHIAYQATREYLKNFGARPPDEPGDMGACNPAAQ